MASGYVQQNTQISIVIIKHDVVARCSVTWQWRYQRRVWWRQSSLAPWAGSRATRWSPLVLTHCSNTPPNSPIYVCTATLSFRQTRNSAKGCFFKMKVRSLRNFERIIAKMHLHSLTQIFSTVDSIPASGLTPRTDWTVSSEHLASSLPFYFSFGSVRQTMLAIRQLLSARKYSSSCRIIL